MKTKIYSAAYFIKHLTREMVIITICDISPPPHLLIYIDKNRLSAVKLVQVGGGGGLGAVLGIQG